MFPNRPPANSLYRLSRDDAQKFLNSMKKKYKENMDIYYPEATKEILDTADKYGWEHYKKVGNIGLGGLTNPDKKYGGKY